MLSNISILNEVAHVNTQGVDMDICLTTGDILRRKLNLITGIDYRSTIISGKKTCARPVPLT